MRLRLIPLRESAQPAEPATVDEAGRVLSSANATAIEQAMAGMRSAMEMLHGVMQKAMGMGKQGDDGDGGDGGDGKMPAGSKKKMSDSQKESLSEAMAMSHGQIGDTLRRALREENKDCYCYIEEVYDDHVIYRMEKRGEYDYEGAPLYRRPYSIDVNGKVTLGDAVKVKVQKSYVAVAEGVIEGDSALDVTGDLIPLEEKSVRKDGTATIKLIRPGWGSSGYYSAAMLKRDGPKAFTRGTKMFWDHPTAEDEAKRPERSLRDLAGELMEDARWVDNGPDGPGLYAEAKVFSPFAQVLDEIAPHIGASIRASGRAKEGEAEGKKGALIEQIVAAKSVDFVTAAGAGGKVLQLLESARAASRASGQMPKERTMEITELAARLTALEEANGAKDTIIAAQAKALAGLQAERQVDAALAASQLPDAARARLRPALIAQAPLTENALDGDAFSPIIEAAIKAEAEYIAQFSKPGAGSGVIGMGTWQFEGAGAGDGPKIEESQRTLTEALGRMGLDEKAAAAAIAGR